MSIIDAVASAPPQTVYLFPTPLNVSFGAEARPNPRDILHFQYWPQSLTDDYAVNYAEHQIPGGSHPLYQWVSGNGRTISFEAIFTSEINTTRGFAGAFSGLGGVSTIANLSSAIIPSSPYTVDITAAMSRLRSYMRADYPKGGQQGLAAAPQILTLVVPGTKLNGKSDSVNVILRAAPITYEAWFPDGQPRVATVSLTFSEVVQLPTGSAAGGDGAGSNVQFIGRKQFSSAGRDYNFRGIADRPLIGGISA